MSNTEKLRRLINKLDQVIKADESTIADVLGDLECGLCYHMDKIFDGGICLPGSFYKDFKHFSGSSTYPIGGEDKFIKHLDKHTLWSGKQLKKRQALAKYIIKAIVRERLHVDSLGCLRPKSLY